jgi:hypothetical protein
MNDTMGNRRFELEDFELQQRSGDAPYEVVEIGRYRYVDQQTGAAREETRVLDRYLDRPLSVILGRAS